MSHRLQSPRSVLCHRLLCCVSLACGGLAWASHCDLPTDPPISQIGPCSMVQLVTGDTTTTPSGEANYTFAANAGVSYTFSFCSGGGTASFDTGLAVFDAGLAMLACIDDTCGLLSELIWPAPSTAIYTVRIGGFGGATGTYSLAYSSADPCVVLPFCGVVVTAPPPPRGGDITLEITATSSAPTVTLTVELSTNAGITWGPAAAAPTSPISNPAVGVPTGIVSFIWDSVADGVGLSGPAPVLIRVMIVDAVGGSSCTVADTIDNSTLAPSCMPTIPATGSDVVTLILDLASPNAPVVDVTIEFSTDGGATLQQATMIPTSPNPNPATAVATGPQAWCWNTRTDGLGLAAPQLGVLVIATVTDGVALFGGTCGGTIDVDNTSLCNGICGDCNLNAVGPDIVDALAAAQISAGILTPGAVQVACCDVDRSTAVSVLDALLIAQRAAGLPVALACN